MENVVSNDFVLFGIRLYNGNAWELIARFCFNFIFAFVLVRYIYYRHWKRNDYAFTYFIFNTLIFFVCFLLSSTSLSIGFAFGLFAVFAILRYRTDPIPIREMTYLFIVITIGVINALSTPDITYLELIFTNLVVLTLTYGLEFHWQKNLVLETIVIYEKIENIKPENEQLLMADLRERTGLDIVKLDIERRDFLRDVARIKIYYRANGS